MSDETRDVHPNALPNYQKAVIPRSKLEDYALNPAYKEGQHKARLFKSILGFERADWQELEKIILNELPYNEALLVGEGQWGRKYLVALPIAGPNGNTATVETIWIIRPETDHPSFVTPRTIKR
jgi:filamentous hemagglutinin